MQILNTTKDLDPHETLPAKQTSILNIFWTHDEKQFGNFRKIYEMPEDVVIVNRTKLTKGAKLSDYVTWNVNPRPGTKNET